MKNSCHCQQDWYEPEKCKNGTCEFFHCDNCGKKSKNMAKKGFQEAFFCGGLNGCKHMLGRSSEKDNSIEQRLEKLSKSDKENLKEWMSIIDDLLHAQAEKIKVQTDKIRQEEAEKCNKLMEELRKKLRAPQSRGAKKTNEILRKKNPNHWKELAKKRWKRK